MIDHGLASNPWHVKDQLKLTPYLTAARGAIGRRGGGIVGHFVGGAADVVSVLEPEAQFRHLAPLAAERPEPLVLRVGRVETPAAVAALFGGVRLYLAFFFGHDFGSFVQPSHGDAVAGSLAVTGASFLAPSL